MLSLLVIDTENFIYSTMETVHLSWERFCQHPLSNPFKTTLFHFSAFVSKDGLIHNAEKLVASKPVRSL